MTKVAVDTMGGNFTPDEMVTGAVEAVNAKPGIRILLVDQEQTVASELGRHTYNKDQIQVANATEVITIEELPVDATRKKKDSSTVVDINLMKKGEADAFVSTGSSGVTLVDGQVIVGRIRGVERLPLAPLIPTERGVSFLIDYRANADTRASHPVQFAQMGSTYMEYAVGIRNPGVAIVNINAEEEKGNALVKETFPLLKECKGINFIGSIGAGEILHGTADVIVYEAFVGNVILKPCGDVGATLINMVKGGMMSALRSKIGALFVKPALKQALKAFNDSQYEGTSLLDLNGPVVKTHGNSKHMEVHNSIIQCITFKEQEVNKKARESLEAKGTE